MKLISKSVVIIALSILTLGSAAQKIKVTEGDVAILKDEPSINIEFTYDNLSVGKFDNEKDYLEKKRAEYNAKEPGRGDTFAKDWVADRKNEFEPAFIELFERSGDMTVKSDAKYTMIFHTTSIEPGFNIMIQRKNAEIDAEVTIVETANRKKVIAVISIKNAPGRTGSGYDWATGTRIKECYAVSGKRLGKLIK